MSEEAKRVKQNLSDQNAQQNKEHVDRVADLTRDFKKQIDEIQAEKETADSLVEAKQKTL